MTNTAYLKLISGHRPLIIPANDGTQTSLRALFDGNDKNPHTWPLGNSSQPASEMPVKVYQGIRDGTLVDIYTSTSLAWKYLCIPQSHVVSFIFTHRRWILSGKSFFFLLKKVGTVPAIVKEDFFAVMCRLENVRLLRFDTCRLVPGALFQWKAEHENRFVIPASATFACHMEATQEDSVVI